MGGPRVMREQIPKKNMRQASTPQHLSMFRSTNVSLRRTKNTHLPSTSYNILYFSSYAPQFKTAIWDQSHHSHHLSLTSYFRWQVHRFVMLQMSIFVAGAAFGDVALSLFLPRTTLKDVGVPLFVARATFGTRNIWWCQSVTSRGMECHFP